MAHQWMRCNLSSAKFPFATRLWGRTIIVPQYDENYDRSIASAADTDKDKGVPQAFYMHNVFPTQEGYQSIGYKTAVPAMAGNPQDFDAVFPIQTPNLGKFLFAPAQGKNYIFDNTVGIWSSISPIVSSSIDANTIVTSAFIRAQTYLFYQNYGCLVYDPNSRTMTNIALSGLVSTSVKGICAANGYMIAWDDTSVVWSSTISETDFIASLITGAGGGQVQEAKGKIICCLPISGGFIIYCERNAVAAKYSGNIRFPFTLVEIPGSGGIQSPEQVSWQSNLTEHYAWTTNGFQQLDKGKSTNLLPEITDFIAAKIFEDFDETTLAFSYQDLSAQVAVKITAIGARYIVVSYGINAPTYTHAIVYDTALKRYGKVKINHRDCFQWNAPNLFGALTYHNLSAITYSALSSTTYLDLLLSINTPEAPKEVFAFLQTDGTVKLIDFALALTDANGVLVIGKFQFQRNRWMIHNTSDVETVRTGNNFNFYLLGTLDGKDIQDPAIIPFLEKRNAYMRRYKRILNKQNISALFVGAFHLTSYLIDFQAGGEG